MRIAIDQLAEKELLLEFEEKPESFAVLADMIRKEECHFLAPITARLRIYQVGEIIEVEGNLEILFGLACSRCLAEITMRVSAPVALTYTRVPFDPLADGDHAAKELNAEDIGLIFFSGEEINLREGIQEHVILALPMQPLCQKSCKGLCPTCGTDLNEGNCSCNQTPVADQFASLRDFKIGES